MPDRAAQLEQLVTAHAAVFAGLLGTTDGLDEATWATGTGCPGWDVHDQLAHCIGIERRLLGDPVREVEVPELAHVRSAASRFTEQDVEARRGVPGGELRQEARETFDRRLEVLRATDPASLEHEAPSLLGTMRLSRVLRMRLFDLVSHERDIRAAIGRLDGFAGPHVEVATEQVLRLWATALPDRSATGGTVGLDLAGSAPVVLDLDTGRLLRGDDAAATPSVRVRLSQPQLLALAGGRDDAPAVDELEVTGDRALAGRFVEVAGVTP